MKTIFHGRTWMMNSMYVPRIIIVVLGFFPIMLVIELVFKTHDFFSEDTAEISSPWIQELLRDVFLNRWIGQE